MAEEEPVKIYCGNCDSIFSVIRYPVPADPDPDAHEVGLGYHGRLGIGEEGVWFCPFCGESAEHYTTVMKELVDEEDD